MVCNAPPASRFDSPRTRIQAISHKEDGGYFKFVRLNEIYPDDCLEVARRFIREGADARYFHHAPDRDLGPTFAFDVVAKNGGRSDVDSYAHSCPGARGPTFPTASAEACAGDVRSNRLGHDCLHGTHCRATGRA